MQAFNTLQATYPNDELERHISAEYSSHQETIERVIREISLLAAIHHDDCVSY